MKENKKGFEIKKVDLDAKSFIANGNQYFLSEGLSFERLWKYELMQRELAFNMSASDLFNLILDTYNGINDVVRDPSKGNNLIVKLHNAMTSLNNLTERKPKIFYISTLFWNKVGEDARVWSNELAEEKIYDWQEEGLDATFFLAQSLSFMKDFLESYNKFIQNTSQLVEQEEILISEVMKSISTT